MASPPLMSLEFGKTLYLDGRARVFLFTIFAMAVIDCDRKPDSQLRVPTTAPVQTPDPRLATPKGAAKALLQAMYDNDMDAAKSCVIPGRDQEKLVRSMTHMMVSMRAATDAAYQRFEGEFREVLDPSVDGTLIDPKLVDDAKETIDGDMALIGMKNGQWMLRLVRKEGYWKIDLVKSVTAGESLSDWESVRVMSDMLDSMAQAATRTRTEIEAGKYSGARPAMVALGASMMAAMREARERAIEEYGARRP